MMMIKVFNFPILHFLGEIQLFGLNLGQNVLLIFVNDRASITYSIKLDSEWEANLIMIHQPRSDTANTNTDVTNDKDG